MAGLAGCNGGGSSDGSTGTQTETSESTTTASPSPTATPTAEPATLNVESVSLSKTVVGQLQPATLTASLSNDGELQFDGTVELAVDTDRVNATLVSTPPGDQTTVEMQFTGATVGDHQLTFRIQRDSDDTVVVEETRQFEVVRYPEHFVGVDGTEFTCGDGSLYLNGANDQQVVATQIPESRIDRVFSIAENLGMNVMRVFGFAPSWSEQAAQPAPREYNEAFFERFDKIIASAKRHGLRLVVPLVNNNRMGDSIASYVEWVDGASEHNDFYEMDACRALYKDYVTHVLTRENSLTGLEYREDPTIALWELGNELNCKWPKKYPLDWIRDVGGHVKQLDNNHPLATGIEALQWGDDPNDKQSWRDGITEDTALIKSNDLDVVDVVTFHLYPDPEMDDIEDPDATFRDIIRASQEMLGKPTFVGEFNWGVRSGGADAIETRNEHFTRWYDTFADENLSGTIVHEISTTEMIPGRKTHAIIPERDDRTAQILRGHSEWARSTSTTSCPGGTVNK